MILACATASEVLGNAVPSSSLMGELPPMTWKKYRTRSRSYSDTPFLRDGCEGTHWMSRGWTKPVAMRGIRSGDPQPLRKRLHQALSKSFRKTRQIEYPCG